MIVEFDVGDFWEVVWNDCELCRNSSNCETYCGVADTDIRKKNSKILMTPYIISSIKIINPRFQNEYNISLNKNKEVL